MNEPQEPHDELSTTFDGLRASVGDTVEVESGLAELHSSAHRRAIPRRWTIAALATTAAAVLAVGLFVSAGNDRQPVAAGPAPDASNETTGEQVYEPVTAEACDEPQIHLYVEPGASPEVVETIRAQLAVIDPEGRWLYADSATTHEEFLRLFADQPDFVDAIRPEDLPTSFRRVLGPELASFDAAALETFPGVLRAERMDEYARILCGAPGVDVAPVDAPAASTTSMAPAPSAAPADGAAATGSAGGCSAPTVVVFVELGATPDRVDQIRAEIEAIDPSPNWQYIDRERTMAEFEELTPEQLEGYGAVSPEDLPTSFRRVVTGELSSVPVNRLSTITGVASSDPGTFPRANCDG